MTVPIAPFAIVAGACALGVIVCILMSATHKPEDRLYVAWTELGARFLEWAMGASLAYGLSHVIDFLLTIRS